MAEVGLLPFARIALQVSKTVRSRATEADSANSNLRSRSCWLSSA
jgi:hypothetical protein